MYGENALRAKSFKIRFLKRHRDREERTARVPEFVNKKIGEIERGTFRFKKLYVTIMLTKHTKRDIHLSGHELKAPDKAASVLFPAIGEGLSLACSMKTRRAGRTHNFITKKGNTL
jgi:hypothetical protein